MDPSAGREQQLKLGGLVVAAVGFLLSRVTLLVVVDPAGSVGTFLTTALVPLVLGLALTTFGISLAVGTFEPWYVNTIALWTLLGTLGMVLVAGLALLNPVVSNEMTAVTAQSSPLVANTLIGGAVGGALIGVRSARNRQQRRELARRSRQVIVLDRILRDEVLNAVTAVRARLEFDGNTLSDTDRVDAIRRGITRIQGAVEDVGFLVQSGRDDRPAQEPRDLAPALAEARTTALDRFPEAAIDVNGGVPADLRVRANDRLGTVFSHLFEMAVERHRDRAPAIGVTVDTDETSATVTVTDDGRPLSEKQARVLTDGHIPEYDDPRVSFGYPIVSFLVDQYGGDVTIETGEERTAVSVTLPRIGEVVTPSERHGVEPEALKRVAGAGLVAGVGMGVVLQTLADTIPVIGSLYGVHSVAVGWVTHLFHSVVFGILFAAALRRPTLRDRVDSPLSTIGAALVFALGLAVVAAGIVMPLWLRTAGVATPVPRLFPAGVLGHLVWGVLLGGLYWLLP